MVQISMSILHQGSIHLNCNLKGWRGLFFIRLSGNVNKYIFPEHHQFLLGNIRKIFNLLVIFLLVITVSQLSS